MALNVLDDRHLEQFCKPGTVCACSFFLLDGGDPCCAKGTAEEIEIRSRLAAGSLRARGDNCSGPPDFRPRNGEPSFQSVN